MLCLIEKNTEGEIIGWVIAQDEAHMAKKLMPYSHEIHPQREYVVDIFVRAAQTPRNPRFHPGKHELTPEYTLLVDGEGFPAHWEVRYSPR